MPNILKRISAIRNPSRESLPLQSTKRRHEQASAHLFDPVPKLPLSPISVKSMSMSMVTDDVLQDSRPSNGSGNDNLNDNDKARDSDSDRIGMIEEDGHMSSTPVGTLSGQALPVESTGREGDEDPIPSLSSSASSASTRASMNDMVATSEPSSTSIFGTRLQGPASHELQSTNHLSDDEVWSKARECLMYTGIPIEPVLIRRAKGTMLYDSNGKEIIDFTSGQMSAILGHSHPEIVQVVTSQVASLDHLLSAMISEPVAQLAQLLTSLLPDPLKRVFFINTGSESNEAAIKIAKCATGKFEIVAFAAGYHGRTGGSASATFICGRRGGGSLMPGSLTFPTPNPLTSPFRKADGSYDWEREMDYGWQMVDCQSVGSLAAFVVEPILSSGGMYEPPTGYFKRLQEGCKKRGMLLIDDEAQTGLGRTGTMWGFERDEYVPDILTLSKTLGAGLPQAAVVTSRKIEDAALSNGFFWVSTHMSDPLTAAVAHKVLSIVIRDDLVTRARKMGDHLRKGLLALQRKYPVIIDVRGRGLLQGMEITSPSALPGATASMTGDILGQLVSKYCMELGLSCNIVNMPGMCWVFRIAPPLTVSETEMDRALVILDQAFSKALGLAVSTPQPETANFKVQKHANGHAQLGDSFPETLGRH